MNISITNYVRRIALQLTSAQFHEVIFGLLPLLLGGQLLLWVVLLPIGLRGNADFGMFYTAGSMVRGGHSHELYDYDVETRFQNALVSKTPAPYTHLPYEALLFDPISKLPYRSAYLMFVVLNLALVVFTGWLMRVPVEHRWLSAAIFVSYFPISAAIADGQDSIILLLITGVAWRLFTRRQEGLAGALLALGLFRFQLVLPIAGLLFLWRRWRFVAGFVLSAVAVLSVSTWLAGIDQMRIYGLHLVSLSSIAAQESGYSLSHSQSYRMVNLRAFFANILPGSQANAVVTLIASFALLLFVAGRGRAITLSHKFAIAVAFSALVSYHLFVYDLAILLIPMMAALGLAKTRNSMVAKTAVLIPLLAVPVFLLWRPFMLALPLLAFLLAIDRAFVASVEGEHDQNVDEGGSAINAVSVLG